MNYRNKNNMDFKMTTVSERPKAQIRARGLRIKAKAADYNSIGLDLMEWDLREPGKGEAVIEIAAAAVNPSDVKAATGLMPYAVFPRTPGRDYAGTVISGPDHLLGKAVFGSSGDLGIRCDGSHATHMIVETDALVKIPSGLSAVEAAGIGVPFVTAWEGLQRAGLPDPGETVLILGLNGKVGQAVAQIASWRGAHVIGVVRRAEAYAGHANGPVGVIAADDPEAVEKIRALTDGKGAEIVFNAVGDPLYELGQKSMAVGGRAVFIAAVDRFVTFDILAFYKGRHRYVGVDTIALDSVRSGAILRELVKGFESGRLKPFPISENAIYAFEDAHEAYRAVIGSSRDRLVLVPEA